MRQPGALGWLKDDITNRGITAWMLTGLLLAFYMVLYYGGQTIDNFLFLGSLGVPVPAFTIPDYIGQVAAATGAALGLDTITKWTIYGFIYTIAITVGGIYVISKYRHNNYQIVRTGVVMFIQISLAFAVPEILKIFDQPALYFSYLWPLEISMLYPSNLGQYPAYFAVWAIVGSMVVAPVLGIFYGKRWYCSWVCGCGGLANTAGEPFRHLTPTSNASWTFEKIAIHTTLILALLATGFVALSALPVAEQFTWIKDTAKAFRSWYGFVFVTMISGILGVVLYPIGGTRIWCRNFCPMAAVLGLVQKFGRYKIKVKDNMCISCGMCTKYCEMGIDVRAYAQANEDFTRSACVGCGLCEEVCPRGVLHLENEWEKDPQELTFSSLVDESYK